MRILLAGASGLIGQELIRQLTPTGHELRRLVRRKATSVDEYSWDPATGVLPSEAIEWAEGVISLSGASLGRLPWTEAYRQQILDSRVHATRLIADAIAHAEVPPVAWVSGSAVGFYGSRPLETLTETSSQGEGFLADVVAHWEEAAKPARHVTRVVYARTGIVLSPAGALKPLFLATKLGLGATVGGGGQHWPWISLSDEAGAIIHLLTESAVEGPVNLVGPTPATAEQITQELATALRRPHILRLPKPLLTLGLGQAAEDLLLADQRVIPQVLTEEEFSFVHPSIRSAVQQSLSNGE